MAIIANGEVLLEGSPAETLNAFTERSGRRCCRSDDELQALEANLQVISTSLGRRAARGARVRATPSRRGISNLADRISKTCTSSAFPVSDELGAENPHAIVLGFFIFELKFRCKSISTYVYFAIWFAFSSSALPAKTLAPIAFGNGKVLLNGPYANIYNDIFSTFFGLIIIAAIFGTSILRDFQRDTSQILFTKPISKFAYLGGRWAGSFVTTAFAFSGLIFGEFLGTLAPWADHTRIAPTTCGGISSRSSPSSLSRSSFSGSLFFAVGASREALRRISAGHRAVHDVHHRPHGVFATRSLEHFWSGIFDPVGLRLFDAITRYWTRGRASNTLLCLGISLAYSPGVFLYNRLLWTGVGVLRSFVVWALFPMSVEALTAGPRASAQRRRGCWTRTSRGRSLARGCEPAAHRSCSAATTLQQYLSLTRLRIRNICARSRSGHRWAARSCSRSTTATSPGA